MLLKPEIDNKVKKMIDQLKKIHETKKESKKIQIEK